MVPRTGDQLEAYVLGLSLAVYATGFLLVWRWWMTVALGAATTVAIAAFSVGANPGIDGQQVTLIVFYMGTAFAMAIAAQVYRERTRYRQHVTQAALEAERHRNAVLVEELEQLSREDPLTSVGDRRAWDEQLARELLLPRRFGRPLSMLRRPSRDALVTSGDATIQPSPAISPPAGPRLGRPGRGRRMPWRSRRGGARCRAGARPDRCDRRAAPTSSGGW